jgi:hypothetical protein
MVRSGSVAGLSTVVMAHGLKDASNWWEKINESRVWQDRIFHVLAALYGVVAAVALVCLFHIFYMYMPLSMMSSRSDWKRPLEL